MFNSCYWCVFAIVSAQINSKSACYPYWPDDLYGSRKTFDSFDVETVSVQNTSSYKVRKLSLKHTSTKQRRIICHLHFTDWPDHGVPQDPKNFLGKFTSCSSLCQQSWTILSLFLLVEHFRQEISLWTLFCGCFLFCEGCLWCGCCRNCCLCDCFAHCCVGVLGLYYSQCSTKELFKRQEQPIKSIK